MRNAIGEQLTIDPRDIQIYVLGEHGDTQFPVWSHGNIGGLNVHEWLENTQFFGARSRPDCRKVKNAAYDIIAAKGSTHYGIAISLARITRSILNDEHAVLPVSVHLEGQYQATDVCISSLQSSIVKAFAKLLKCLSMSPSNNKCTIPSKH